MDDSVQSEPVTAAVVEEGSALWSIFLCDPSDISAGKDYCLGLKRSGHETISPVLEMTPPRCTTSLRQKGV